MRKLYLSLIVSAFVSFQACKQPSSTPNKSSGGTTQPSADMPSSSSKERYKTDASKASFYLSLSKPDKDASEILESMDDHKSFTGYARGSTRESLVEDYGTVVHESCHAYNFDIGGFDTEGYFIGDGIKIVVPETETFISSELNKVIPKAWQEEIFRYNTYVGSGSNTSSQKHGIYGMLNEFTAYYHGGKAQVKLRSYYETQCGYQNLECWTKYITNPASELTAYYEFRLFMAWYLNYAEQKHSKVYQGLMNNQALRVAYTLADQAFAQLWTDYLRERESVITKLKGAGHNVAIKNGFFYVYRNDGSSHGVGLSDDDVAYLKGLFKEKDLQQLKKFGIEGLSKENYQSFLKG